MSRRPFVKNLLLLITAVAGPDGWAIGYAKPLRPAEQAMHHSTYGAAN